MVIVQKGKGLKPTICAFTLSNLKIMSKISQSKQNNVIFAFNKEVIKRRVIINGLENRKGVWKKINKTLLVL